MKLPLIISSRMNREYLLDTIHNASVIFLYIIALTLSSMLNSGFITSIAMLLAVRYGIAYSSPVNDVKTS